MKLPATLMLLLLTAGTAFGDIGLARDESITIRHKRYICEPSQQPRRKDVVLAAGESIKVDRRRVTCELEDGGDGPPAPPPVPTIEISSRVDLDCANSLYMKVSGRLSGADAMEIASACRNVEIPKVCRLASQTRDDACYESLYRKVTGEFDGSTAARVQHECKQLVATCLAPSPHRISSQVDTDCFGKLYRSTRGQPSVAMALDWVRSCRSAPIERCVAVSGAFDADCVNTVYRAISGRLAPSQAADIARQCRRVEASCAE